MHALPVAGPRGIIADTVRLRLFIVGAVLVLILGLIGFLVWRGGPATRSTQPPAARSTPAAPAPRVDRTPIRLSSGAAEVGSDATHAFELEGRVLSTASGAGIPGAVIVLSDGNSVSETRADATGHFRWTTPSPGAYQLASLEAAGFVSFAPELGQSSIVFQARLGVRLSDVTLYLAPSRPAHDAGAHADAGPGTPAPIATNGVDASTAPRGRISGTVREADTGKPITAFSIIALVRRGGVERGAEQHGSFFDNEGRFVLDGVAPGTQCVTALALGHAASAEQCLEVTAGGDSRVELKLGRGASLSGRVTDRAKRTPLAHARVALEQPYGIDADSPLPVIASTETGEDGTFHLTGLDSGLRSIFVTAATHHSRVVPGIRLDADRQPPSIEIDLLATEPGEEPHIESAGINAAVRAEGDTLVISGVATEGGAAQAGLLAGDVILRVDGVDLGTLGMQAGVERMRGPEGSTVVLTVRRPPDPATRDVVVTRRRIVNRF